MRTKKLFENTPLYPILIVDPDGDSGADIASFLADLNWKTTQAKNLAQANNYLETCEDEAVVILCERELEDGSANALLSSIDPQKHGLVMMSKMPDPTEVADAMNRGAQDYVFKPIENWDRFNKILLRTGQRLSKNLLSVKESQRLAKLADWQSWKAGFLNNSKDDDKKQLLRNLHVQLNQDTNYSHLLRMLEESTAMIDDASSENITLSRDLVELVTCALRPVARFSDGIGIAAAILGDVPTLHAIQLSDVLTELREVWKPRWSREAEKRSHEFEFWVAPETRNLREMWLEIDHDTFFKAINELMVNSLKHSDSGTPITLNISATPERFSVTLTNPPSVKTALVGNQAVQGIPREFEDQVFRLFVRLQEQAITLYEEDWPMGLGLPLVKAVLQSAKAELTVRNEVWHLSGHSQPTLMVTARASLPLHKYSDKPVFGQKSTVDAADSFELF